MTPEQTTAVALSQESRDVLDGLMVVREVLAPDLTVAELQLFALVATRSGLDPFARQIYAVKRKGRMAIQTGIDGYRSIAVRTGEYDGQDEPTYSVDCPCSRLPHPHPVSSTVRVYRKGMGRAVAATAFWHEYMPEAGQSGNGDAMWRKMPHVMIAKVAEALALRKAFPWDPNARTGIGSDVYTEDEMAQAAAPDAPAAPAVSVQERIQQRAEAVSVQTGVVGVTLRYFADAVRDMEPEQIRRIREEMYPEASGVGSLDDEQRARLLDRLITLRSGGEDPEGGDGPDEASGVVPEPLAIPPGTGVDAENEEPVDAGDPSAEYVMCGDTFGPPLGQGEVCVLEAGHPGPHKDEAGSRWPGKKGSRR